MHEERKEKRRKGKRRGEKGGECETRMRAVTSTHKKEGVGTCSDQDPRASGWGWSLAGH